MWRAGEERSTLPPRLVCTMCHHWWAYCPKRCTSAEYYSYCCCLIYKRHIWNSWGSSVYPTAKGWSPNYVTAQRGWCAEEAVHKKRKAQVFNFMPELRNCRKLQGNPQGLHFYYSDCSKVGTALERICCAGCMPRHTFGHEHSQPAPSKGAFVGFGATNPPYFTDQFCAYKGWVHVIVPVIVRQNGTLNSCQQS